MPSVTRTRLAVVVMVASLLAPMAAACAASSSEAAKDVTVTACDADPAGGKPMATGQITNHSSKASGYVIHVTFIDSSGNKVADGGAAVAKVDAGTTATWHAGGTADAKGPLTCKVVGVTRNAVVP
jgi:hypothetical protein